LATCWARCWAVLGFTTWKINPRKEPLKVGVILRHFTIQRKVESASTEGTTESRDTKRCFPLKGTRYSRETVVHDKAMERYLFTLQRKVESEASEVTTESRDTKRCFPLKGTRYSRETVVHDKAMERYLFTLQRKVESEASEVTTGKVRIL
jgi:predicted house-cleaning noncanonical NTP pyrophosphatase (MazG superfamily)